MSTLTTHTTATRATPSGSNIGLCKFNTTTNAIEVSDGSSWQVYDPDTVTGWSGSNTYSLNFDGTDDRLTSSPVTSSAQQGTISAWIKTSNTATNSTIFTQTDVTDINDNTWLFFSILSTGEPRLGWRNGTPLLIKKGSTTVNDGNWHHIAWTCDGSAWKIYVDGDDEGTLTTVSGTASDGNWFGDLSSIDTCRIGCQERNLGLDSFFNGNIDEVAVWDSALSAAQITNIYKGESNGGSGGTNSTPGNLLSFSPKAWWRMGDGAEANSGTTVYDMSGYINNMTIVNATSGTNTAGTVYQLETP